MQNIELSDLEMEQLHGQLRALPEHRGGGRELHPLATVLTIAIAATLAGVRGYLAIAEFAGGLSQAQLKRVRAYFSRRRNRFEPPSEPAALLRRPPRSRARPGARPLTRPVPLLPRWPGTPPPGHLWPRFSRSP